MPARASPDVDGSSINDVVCIVPFPHASGPIKDFFRSNVSA